jgi:hypothetical protein
MGQDTNMTKGSKMTPEQKKRLGDSHRGSHRSSETKKKMSISHMGHAVSFETRKKISKGHLGIKASEESRKKMSESRKGKNNSSWKGGVSKDKNHVHGLIKLRRIERMEKLAKRKKPSQCELCGAMGLICFDHDHATGKFRGWICRRCNLVLGLAKDSTELLSTLINYLNSNDNK